MDVPQKHPEFYRMLQELHVQVRVLGHGPVIEHEKDAREDLQQEREKSEASQAEGEPDMEGRFRGFYWMEMKKRGGENREGTIPGSVCEAMTEYRAPQLAFSYFLHAYNS